MDKVSSREREANRLIRETYRPRSISLKVKILIAVLGVAVAGVIFGFENLVIAGVVLFFLAVLVALGYTAGYDNGKYAGEESERRRMLDEGYSLDSRNIHEEDDGVKPLRACKWCGHIVDEDERAA